MDRVREFLQLYNQLDEFLRRVLRADAQRSHANLLEQMAQRDPVFRDHHSRLQAYRALRNSIIHVPFSGESPEPIAEPRDDVLENYRMVVQYVLRPPTALETIATRDVFTATWDTLIHDALSFIQKHGYDTVPILEGQSLVGIYTTQCLQRLIWHAMADGRDLRVSPSDTLREWESECAFSTADPDNSSHHTSLVKFAPADVGVEAIEELFRAEARQMRFLAAVCVTPHGRAFEPLLGLITPHNLPSANGYSNFLDAVRRRLTPHEG